MVARNVKIPADRRQIALLPPSLDEYVKADNSVRAIDCYIENLDLDRLGFRYASGELNAGQPSYHPKELAKLYLYGYLHKLRSSRHLAAEAGRNLELIWLLGKLCPSHTTIANFRKDNATALVALNRDFLLLCQEMNLLGGNSVAIDGSFFKGNASKSSIFTQKRLSRDIERLETRIRDWQEQLDACDNDEKNSDPVVVDPGKLSVLKDRLVEKKALDKALKKSGGTQISTTDPDARLLSKRGQSISGYNIQIAVDDKNKLLIASSVTHDGNDSQQLAPLSLEAKNNLGVDRLNSYADAGYTESNQFKICEDAGITAYVPLPNRTKFKKEKGYYSRDDFIYDEENKTYTCPHGIELVREKILILKKKKNYYRFHTKSSDCQGCPLKSGCLKGKSTRKMIYRWEHEAVLDRHKRRMLDNPQAMKKRMALAEHPFGTLKCRAGWNHFLVRGFKKVRGEWSLMSLCYNWTRALNIVGIKEFMKVCSRGCEAA